MKEREKIAIRRFGIGGVSFPPSAIHESARAGAPIFPSAGLGLLAAPEEYRIPLESCENQPSVRSDWDGRKSRLVRNGLPSDNGSSAPPRLSPFRAYWERLRCVSLKQALVSLVPRKYDMYLYQGTRETLAATPVPSTSLPITIEHYGPGEYTGNPEIDNLLFGTREVYVAKVDGVVAHRCVLMFALRRPQKFGFPEGPLVAEGFTRPEYRGKGLQAVMRRVLMEDVLNRGLSDYLYGEIKLDNFASMKGNTRGGLRRVVRLQGIKFAGLVLFRRVLPPFS